MWLQDYTTFRQALLALAHCRSASHFRREAFEARKTFCKAVIEVCLGMRAESLEFLGARRRWYELECISIVSSQRQWSNTNILRESR